MSEQSETSKVTELTKTKEELSAKNDEFIVQLKDILTNSPQFREFAINVLFGNAVNHESVGVGVEPLDKKSGKGYYTIYSSLDKGNKSSHIGSYDENDKVIEQVRLSPTLIGVGNYSSYEDEEEGAIPPLENTEVAITDVQSFFDKLREEVS
jgi:hypothetical protein